VSPDIPYGRDYPEQPWIDHDGEPIDERPVDVHRGQARIAYRVAGRYADRLMHVTGLGWHHWDGTRFRPDDRGAAKRAVLAELRRALAESLGDKELRSDVRKCESASGVARRRHRAVGRGLGERLASRHSGSGLGSRRRGREPAVAARERCPRAPHAARHRTGGAVPGTVRRAGWEHRLARQSDRGKFRPLTDFPRRSGARGEYVPESP
jgi:hypothetical protein